MFKKIYFSQAGSLGTGGGGGGGALNSLTPNSGISPVTPTGGTINVSGSGSITTVGTGVSTLTIELQGLTANAVLFGQGTTTIGNTGSVNDAVLTTSSTGIPTLTPMTVDGGLLIGSSIGQPTVAQLSAGSGVSIVNGHNSITISATGGLSWVSLSASTTLASNTGYVCSSGGVLSLALPATSALGDEIIIILDGSTGFTVTQGAGQQVRIGINSTTLGAGGSLSSNAVGDSITMRCTVANTIWRITASEGNPTLV